MFIFHANMNNQIYTLMKPEKKNPRVLLCELIFYYQLSVTGFFSLGEATSLGEGKLWIQTC